MNPPPRVLVALLGLTFVTGLIDAASLLGLGHVFVANMTGNIVFLGFSLLGEGSTSLTGAVLALCGFLLGALIGGRCAHSAARGTRLGLGLDVLSLGCGACATLLGAPIPIVIFFLALAMGTRTALVRALAVPDITTTVLTLTLTGLAADSSLAGGNNPRLGRRVASVIVMLVGAGIGALLNAHVRVAVIPCAALCEAAAAIALVAGSSNTA